MMCANTLQVPLEFIQLQFPDDTGQKDSVAPKVEYHQHFQISLLFHGRKHVIVDIGDSILDIDPRTPLPLGVYESTHDRWLLFSSRTASIKNQMRKISPHNQLVSHEGTLYWWAAFQKTFRTASLLLMLKAFRNTSKGLKPPVTPCMETPHLQKMD